MLPCATIATGIDDLREKREEITKQLREDEGEKAKIQADLQTLTKRLAQVNDSVARKVRCTKLTATAKCALYMSLMQLFTLTRYCALQMESRTEYDKVIAETESAYLKILESSQVSAVQKIPIGSYSSAHGVLKVHILLCGQSIEHA